MLAFKQDIALRSVCSELMSSASQSVRQTACSEQPERTIVFCHLLLFCLHCTVSMWPSLNGECGHRFAQSEQMKILSSFHRVHILSQSQSKDLFCLDTRCLIPEMQCPREGIRKIMNVVVLQGNMMIGRVLTDGRLSGRIK